jgi:serralysin
VEPIALAQSRTEVFIARDPPRFFQHERAVLACTALISDNAALAKETQMANKTGNDKNNSIKGTADNDVLKGLGGDDLLIGGQGNDRLYGGDDLDELDGGYGNDKLYGESGNDILLVSSGDDMLDGGAGINVLNFRNIYKNVTVSLADGYFKFTDGMGTHTTHFKNVEILQGGSFNDRLIGDVHRNMLRGAEGNDVLMAVDGDDYLFGGLGHETMTGGRGKDGFLFGAEATGENFDKVRDFSDKDDWLAFDSLVFKGLKGAGASTEYVEIVTRQLDADQFQAGQGHAAETADVRIIYDESNGILYYDSNGSKAGGLGEIADLGEHHDLSASDIFVF